MKLRTRIDGGGTKPLENWGVDSEYGTLRDVLIGPIDHFTWQPGNAVCQRAERVGLKFDFAVARRQYAEMVDVYRQKVNPNVSVYSVNLSGHAQSQFRPGGERTHLLSGWSEKIVDLVRQLEGQGEVEPNRAVPAIEVLRQRYRR